MEASPAKSDHTGTLLVIENVNKSEGNPLQYCCLEISTDEGAWWATVHGVSESRTL